MKELPKLKDWSQANYTVATLPENRQASLRVGARAIPPERSCDIGSQKTLDGRGRRPGWKPSYNKIQTRNYQSQWERQQKSFDLRPTFSDRGIMIFQSQRGSQCESYVVRTPEFDGSRPEWWLDFPTNLFEIISPAFWSDWPPTWIYPPADVNPFISGEPIE
jgi:hypothetical protein